MTSDQKYEGGGNNASFNERTANNEPQTPVYAVERFVIDPETLEMLDTETGERFAYKAIEPDGREVSGE